MVYPNENYPGRAITEHSWKIEDVEKEFRAQIELALKNIQHISHFSVHMGCTNLSPEVRALTIRLAKDINSGGPEWDYKGFVGYDGPHKTSEEKIESFYPYAGQVGAR